jgi:hypothetical protein
MTITARDFRDPLKLINNSAGLSDERITCFTYSHMVRRQYTVYYYTGGTLGQPPHEYPLVVPGGGGNPAGFLSAEEARKYEEMVRDFPANMPVLLWLRLFKSNTDDASRAEPIDMPRIVDGDEAIGLLRCVIFAAHIFGIRTDYWYSGKSKGNLPIVEPHDSGSCKAGFMDAAASSAIKDFINSEGWYNVFIMTTITKQA